MDFPFCTIAYRFEKKSIVDIIYELSNLGYTSLEIWAPQLLKQPIEKMKSALDKTNTKVTMVSPYFNFTSGLKWWKKSLCLAQVLLEISQKLECPYLRCFSGNVGSQSCTKKQWGDAVSGMQILADMSAKYGVSLAIETHANTLADTERSILKLLSDIKKPNVGLVFDPYNLWETIEDSVYSVTDELYPYVYGLHLKNAQTDHPKNSPFPFVHKETADISSISYIETGNVSYNSFFNKFFQKEFNGFMAIEWFGTNILSAAKHELDYMTSIERNHREK